MFSTHLIQPVLAFSVFGSLEESMIFFLPIMSACIIVFVFMRFPKTGITLSVLLCLLARELGLLVATNGVTLLLLMVEIGIASTVGIVACVIQMKINTLSDKSEGKNHRTDKGKSRQPDKEKTPQPKSLSSIQS